jgi:hypothetical protein
MLLLAALMHGIHIPHVIRKVTGVFRYSADHDTQAFQF